MADFSPENPLLPNAPGWNYSGILPLAQRLAPQAPIMGTDESGKLLPFTQPSMALSLPGVLRSSLNELANAVTLPGRVAQGQVSPQSLPQEAIKASLAIVSAGAGGGMSVKHMLEPIEHDPFAVASEAVAQSPQLVPVDHDPFAVVAQPPLGTPLVAAPAATPRIFTQAELARGRNVPVSNTSPAAGNQLDASRQAQGLDPVAEAGNAAAARNLDRALDIAGKKRLQPSELAIKARKRAEENMTLGPSA